MKKTIILSIVFCALFAYLPFAAQAGIITALTAEPDEGSEEAGASASYGFDFTLSSPVASGTTIALLFLNDEDEAASTFDVTDCEFAEGHDFTDATVTTDGPANVYVRTNEDLAPGAHSFTLTDVTNGDAGNFYISMGFGDDFKSATDIINGDEFTLTAAVVTNVIETVSFEASSTYTSASNDLNVVFTTSGAIESAGDVYFMFVGEGSPQESGFDFSSATFSNAAENLDQVFSCGVVPSMAFLVKCTALMNVPKNDTEGYDIIISGVVNSSIADTAFDFASTSDGEADSLNDYAIAATTLTLTEAPDELEAPGKIKKSKLKIKNKKKKSAKLKWKAKATATKYRVILEKKKAKKKGFKQVKKWKNITKTYKMIKKKKKLLKSKTKFRYKVRAGNAAGWGAWSEYKKFTMK